MKYHKKSFNYLFATFVLASQAINYPEAEFMKGSDSFEFATMSKFIIHEGMLIWLLTPLSYIGLYPFSEVSGASIIISTISVTFGLSIERSIFFFCSFISFILFSVSFLFFRLLTRENFSALIGAYVITTSRMVVKGLNWTLHPRTLYFILFVLIIFLIQKSFRKNKVNFKFLSISFFALITSITFHNIFLLGVLAIISILIWSILSNSRFFNIRVFEAEGTKWPLFLMTLIIIIGLALPFTSYGLYQPSIENYSSGIVDGTTLFHIYFNLSFDYAMAIGLPIILAPLSLLGILDYKKRYSYPYLAMFLLPILSPFLIDSQYILYISSIIIFICILFGVKNIFIMFEKNSYVVLSLSIIILFSAFVPEYLVSPRETKSPLYSPGTTSSMNPETFNLGLYLNNNLEEGSFVCNDVRLARKLAFVSEKPIFTNSMGSIGDLIYSFKDPYGLRIEYRSDLDLQTIIDSKVNVFVEAPEPAQFQYSRMINSEFEDHNTGLYLDYYDVRLVVVNNFMRDKAPIPIAPNVVEIKHSPFFSSVNGNSYPIYSDEIHTTYLLN